MYKQSRVLTHNWYFRFTYQVELFAPLDVWNLIQPWNDFLHFILIIDSKIWDFFCSKTFKVDNFLLTIAQCSANFSVSRHPWHLKRTFATSSPTGIDKFGAFFCVFKKSRDTQKRLTDTLGCLDTYFVEHRYSSITYYLKKQVVLIIVTYSLNNFVSI